MYNNTIGLIDSNYVINNSEIFINIEPKFIEAAILRIQNIYIKNTIGSGLYKLLVDAYEDLYDNGTIVPTRLSNLMDNYLAPTLVSYTIYDLIVSNLFKITPQGLLKSKGIDGETISIDEFNILRNIWLSRAEDYSKSVIDFLTTNSNTYPESFQPSDDDYDIIDNKPFKKFWIGGSSRNFKNPYCCDE